jgi:hypothetical protein
MKQKLYYQEMFGRINRLKIVLLDFFLAASATFRIPIEMLIRKNFGERYFSLFLSVVIGVALFAYPSLFNNYNRYGETDTGTLLKYYSTWYLYAVVYTYCLFKRWQEVRHEPSVFDFARFSLSNGKIHPFFINLTNAEQPNIRRIETLYEPGVFFIGGAILAYFSQPIGFLFLVCAVVYSLGYVAAYAKGDDFVMDIIDNMICNQELSETFVEGNESPTGFKFYGTRPDDKKMRDDMYDTMTGEDEEEPTIVN